MKLIEITEKQPLSQKILPKIMEKLKNDLASLDGWTLELKPVPDFIRRSLHTPDYVKQYIVLNMKGNSQAVERMRTRLIMLLTKHLPKDNLLGVVPHIFETNNGCTIVLKDKETG